jgi:hypothetical protein
MIARIAAATMITHLAQVAGHQNMAKTTTAKANKNRQKQSFMIFPPSYRDSINFIEEDDSIARLKTIVPKIADFARQ